MGLIELASEIQEDLGIDLICDREENSFYGFGGDNSDIEFRFTGEPEYESRDESNSSDYVLELEKELRVYKGESKEDEGNYSIMLRISPSNVEGLMAVQIQVPVEYFRAFVFHLLQGDDRLYPCIQNIAKSLQNNNKDLLSHESELTGEKGKDNGNDAENPQYILDEFIISEGNIKGIVDYILSF